MSGWAPPEKNSTRRLLRTATASSPASMNTGYVRTGKDWGLISPQYVVSTGSYVRYATSTGSYGFAGAGNVDGVRPVIVLAPGITISSGNGTYNNPYIIENPVLNLIPGQVIMQAANDTIDMVHGGKIKKLSL